MTKQYGEPKITVRMPKELIDRLRAAAKQCEVSLSEFMRHTAERALLDFQEAESGDEVK